MSSQPSRKEILDRIKESRNAQDKRLKIKSDRPLVDSRQFYDPIEELPEVAFARNLVEVKGKFSYCTDSNELNLAFGLLFKETGWKKAICFEEALQKVIHQAGCDFSSDPGELPEADVVITGCEYLIARTGSILVSSRQGSGRRAFATAPVHIVVGHTSQIVNEMKDALLKMQQKYQVMPSQITLITGPSRTADIEKTLVMGVHGPADLYVFLLNDQG